MQFKNRKGNDTRGVMPRAIPGFIVVDSSFSPIFMNSEAVAILNYPKGLRGARSNDKNLIDKMKSFFTPTRDDSIDFYFTNIQSGRRSYVCSLFSVKTSLSRKGLRSATAILLERNSKSLELQQVSDSFSFTQRERQVVQLLTQGLTTKEIAERLKISPNTVKTFLRLVMAKTEVTTRTGVIGKLLQHYRT